MGMYPSDPPVREYIITDAEAAAVGVTWGSHPNTWGEILKPIILAKGCPEKDVYHLRTMPRTQEQGYTVFRLFPKETA